MGMHKQYIFIVVVLLLVSAISAMAQTLLPRKYPSLRVAHVIPGDETYQAPNDQEAIDTLMALYGRADADAVKLWESQHADLTSGGHTGVAAYNANYRANAYVYFQRLFTAVDIPESGLRKVAIRNGWNYEAFHVHFKEDTWVDGNRYTQTGTVFHGRPQMIARTLWWNHAGETGSWDEAIQRSNQGGGCWILMPEKFGEMTVFIETGGDPGSTGELVIEYPNQVDENFRITGWGRINPYYDGTNGLRQTGRIAWIPPADWKWCVPYPPYFLGHVRLGHGCGCYLIRIRTPNYVVYPRFGRNEQGFPVWMRSYINLETTDYRTGAVVSATSTTVVVNVRGDAISEQYRDTDYYKDMTIEIISGRGTGQVRTITASGSGTNNINLTISPAWDVIPDSTSRYKITGPTMRIPGWDPANDQNGDGYVDDTEYANLVNPNATARFEWEARVTTGFRHWSPSNATVRANVFNPQYRQALLSYYGPYFQSLNISGYDNDDAMLFTGGRVPVLRGGRIHEYPSGEYPTGYWGKDYNLEVAYRDGFFACHNLFKQNGFGWVGTNISINNMIVNPFRRVYLNTFTFFRCEQVFMDSQGLTSYSGLLRAWYLPAYAAAGVRSVVQCQTAWGNFISNLGNTQEAWERLTLNKLAMFYLINVPDYTFFQNWNRTYDYGSANTLLGTSIRGFWKAGVPQNMAYHPTALLSVDIGAPANRMPDGAEPITYILGVDGVPGSSFYTQIGNSTQSTLTVPALEGGTIQVATVPTYAYYIWRTPQTTYGVPVDAVVAREYTKGLVLCRMPGVSAPGGYASYINSTVRVTLPGVYRKVNYDGTLGPPITEIDVRGFDGIILVKAGETSQPNVQLTISADKTNPKPLDVVTVRITATNTGNAEARNVRIMHDIPQGATYVRGSLKLNGNTLPDPTDTTKIDVTVASIPAGGQTVVEFQMVIR